MSQIRCPSCGESSDARKVSLLFEQGTTVNKMNPMVGVGMGGGHLGIGVASGIGWKGQSALAARLAPPRNPTFNPATWPFLLLLGSIGLINIMYSNGIVAGVILFSVVAVGLLVYTVRLHRDTDAARRAALARWNRQWCCMRCGEVFAVA